jgi:hypothetical protein
MLAVIGRHGGRIGGIFFSSRKPTAPFGILVAELVRVQL